MITQKQANSLLKLAHANIKDNKIPMPVELLTSLSSLLIIEKDKKNKNDSFICEATRLFSLFIWSELLPVLNEQKSFLQKIDNKQSGIELKNNSVPVLIKSVNEMLNQLEQDTRFNRVIHKVESTIREICKPVLNAKAIYEYYFNMNRYNFRDIECPVIDTSTINEFNVLDDEHEINFSKEDMPKFINIYTRFLMDQYYGEKEYYNENFIRLVNTIVIAFSSLFSEVQLLKIYDQHSAYIS
ncbi:MAG: hypothetical protein HQL46_13760 [Gammaproteobacteria bacterium]|nr:hypothetical protein [Gammaproteobacteria bacterium]